MGLDPEDPCRIDVGREPTLHAETAAVHRKESRRSTVETTVKYVESQTAWIADSDGVMNSSDETYATNSIRKRGTPRERWG